ncbi:MAG: hypothetical protein WD737_14585 [Gemmatimonadota bacterium]
MPAPNNDFLPTGGQTMKICICAALAALLLSACSVPFSGGMSDDENKAACDQFAAQAIQTESPARARVLAAQASECYARLPG